VGIIGCGAFGKLHSELIKTLKLFEIHAYADVNISEAEKCRSTFNAKYCSRDYRDIINDPEIDAVFVCTPHDSHYPIAIDAIAAGKHVFMEKPMAMTVKQCEEIENAIKGRNTRFMVGHKMRFSPNVQRVKREIKKPLIIIAQMMCDRWADDMWAQDPVKGGGNVLSQGCHIFDLVTYLAGDWPETIYAQGGSFTHPGSGIIDNIAATVKFRNGVVANVTIGDAGYNGFTSKTMVQIYTGEECINLSKRLYKYSRYKSRNVEEYEFEEDYTNLEEDPEGFYAEIKEFHDCIVNDRNPSIGAKEGGNAVKMVYAAFKSVRTGEVQNI